MLVEAHRVGDPVWEDDGSGVGWRVMVGQQALRELSALQHKVHYFPVQMEIIKWN